MTRLTPLTSVRRLESISKIFYGRFVNLRNLATAQIESPGFVELHWPI